MISRKYKTLFPLIFLFCLLMQNNLLHALNDSSLLNQPSNAGWFSLGVRSTASAFSEDGTGIGSGGQFRIQLSNKVNTDWFADYIVVSNNPLYRSEYLHIGWSVLFYPFDNLYYPKKRLQPFVLAGHCFDYNKKTIIPQPNVSASRWGAAVQGGCGTHINFSERFDITFMIQYMIHLTSELDIKNNNNVYEINTKKNSALEGHMLSTVSVNYKIFKAWKK